MARASGADVMRRVHICVLLIVACAVDGRSSFQWFRTTSGRKDVMTEAGLVRGSTSVGGDYIEFLGVPYAAPPTGTSRFRAPIPPYSWNGVYEADRIVRCPQRGDGMEDCLVLNIFTPTHIKDPVPVLVYFHGGAFIIGRAPVQGMSQLIKQNIVVVTVNYRLGAFGFLCLGVEEAPGNAGLKDQLAALQWIRRNIVRFGGDPNKVTIYGMSAGAASVELLVLSQRANGLFTQAIVESASATSAWSVDVDPFRTALKVAEKLNFPLIRKSSYWVKSLAGFYQRARVKHLSTVNYDYYNDLTDGTFGFVPCIEKLNNSNAFMTESPYKTLTREKYKKVPMMFFFAASEGLFLRSEEYYLLNYKERMEVNFAGFLPGDLDFDNEEIRAATAANVKDFYFGNRPIGEHMEDYLNYFGDSLILHGLLNSVEIHSRDNNPVYLMEFAYRGNMGTSDPFYSNISVAGHGDVVKHAILERQPRTKSDEKAVARVSQMIGNFVKNGDPIPRRTKLFPILWPQVRPGNVTCLRMDEDFSIVDEPHWDVKEFWDSIYSKFRKQLFWKEAGIIYDSLSYKISPFYHT